jgi:CheY-like chemotaxis protein
MNEKILFVDDDPNLLASCERTLRQQFLIETAEGGDSGLAKLAGRGPFAVVVADRQMPRMDGIEFLRTVRKRAPDTVRVMLTGNADLEGAIRVVNEGNIFRFLTKPCPPDVLTHALKDAQAQYRLVTAQKELLNNTLNGSIKLLTDILSMVDHQSFGRAQTLRDAITAVTARLYVENAWEIHLAVMLASIGYVTVPPETLIKSRAGQPYLQWKSRYWRACPKPPPACWPTFPAWKASRASFNINTSTSTARASPVTAPPAKPSRSAPGCSRF